MPVRVLVIVSGSEAIAAYAAAGKQFTDEYGEAFELVFATDLPSGLERWEENGPFESVVAYDNIEGHSTVDFIRFVNQLHKTGFGGKLVVVTGSTDADYLSELIEIGCDDICTTGDKPYTVIDSTLLVMTQPA